MGPMSSSWFWRNQQIHDLKFEEPFQLVEYIKGRVHEFQIHKDRLNKGPSMTSIHIAWQRPSTGWVKINVDGVVAKRSGHAACGGLICSAQGSWLGGFKHRVGSSSILWGIWKGL